MIVAGIFAPDERVELVNGVILSMAPQGSLHATAIRLVEDALRRVFAAGFDVRVQLPLVLDPDSEPEPDVAVVMGSCRDYRDMHPSTAVLIVEISESTAERDRKVSLYASAGIPEYWILDLPERHLEVHRDPAPSISEEPGLAYRDIQRILPGRHISPVACPDARIPLDDILP
jgi:Uma2 family endonuclease